MPQTQRYTLVWLLLLLWLPISLFSQQTVTITVLDKESKEPVQFAHLCFEDKKSGKQYYQLSDSKGQVSQAIQGPTVLATSVMGYKTRMDTLTASGTLTLLLEPSFFDMDEVVVTAQMSPKKADQSIYQVKVLNSKLISEKAATNLSDLLSGELGLRISQDGALGSSMSMNGLSGEHVKILIDGVPVIGRNNGNIDLSQLNLNNVDHIEIVEGPMSVQYGSNALAGAVNIITKENLRNKLLASVNAYYESVGVYNANATLSINKNKNSFSLNGGRNFFGGYSEADTSRSQQWKPKEQYFTDAYYIFKKDKLKLRLDGKYFKETIQNKGEIRGLYDIWALDSYFLTDRLTSKAQLSFPIREHSTFDIMTSWSGYKRTKNTYRKDMTTLDESLASDPSLQDTTTFSSWLSRGNYVWQPKSEVIALQSGFDLNYEKGEGRRILNSSQDIGDYAAFFSAQYNPTKKISLQPGLRIAYNTKYNAPLVPSINFKVSPSEKLDFRLSYVRGFRSPSLKELYLYFVDINHDVRGNPDLKAENSHNFNFSVQYDYERNSNFYGFEFNTFSNIINSKIDLVNDTANIYTYANINEFRSLGYNLKYKYRMHPRLNVTFGISQTGIYSSISELSHALDNYIFSTDIVSEFRYDLFKYGINLSVFYKYNGKYPYYYLDSDDEIALGYMNSYNSLDVTLSKSFFKKNLVLSLGGKNLFNVTNIPRAGAGAAAHAGGEGSSPVAWGRTFFMGLNYKFGTF
jgi:outer membrane receptor for ferrienterochelin and colicins